MRKKIMVVFPALLTVLFTAGCSIGMSEGKKAETERKAIVDEYLKKQGSDMVCYSARTVKAVYENGGATPPTNYIAGRYGRSDGKLSYDYYFDTVNGKMYSTRGFTYIHSCAGSQVKKDLGLDPDKVQNFDSETLLYLPDVMVPGEPDARINPIAVPYAPAEIDSMQAAADYLENPDRGAILEVSLEIGVDAGEEPDLEDFTIERLYFEAAEKGFYYKNLTLHVTRSVTYDRVGYGAKPEIVDRETYRKYGEYLGCGKEFVTYELWSDAEAGEPADPGASGEAVDSGVFAGSGEVADPGVTWESGEAFEPETLSAYRVVYRRTEYIEPGADTVNIKEEKW